MKRISLIIALLIITSICKAQSEEAIFNINSERIITTKSNMIDPVGTDNVLFKGYSSSTNVTVGNTVYTVKTAVGENENADFGFNIISIYNNNSNLLTLKDHDMWTYTYSGRSTTNYKSYTDNKYFITIDLSQYAKALLFIGWPYGGDLPILTIIVLTENDAKLVFNKNMGISTITKTDNQYLIKVKTVLEEYDSSGRLTTSPKYNYITLENEILKLK